MHTCNKLKRSQLPGLEFRRSHPRIDLNIAVVSSRDVIDMLKAEDVDIGFGFVHDQPSGIEIALRRDVRIGALMPIDHPLASVKNLSLQDCLKHSIAIARPEISLRGIIDPYLDKMGSLPPVVEANSIQMLVELTKLGGHIAIMTPIGAQREIANGEICFRPLEDTGLPLNRFAILLRSHSNLQFGPAVFYEFVLNRLAAAHLPGAI